MIEVIVALWAIGLFTMLSLSFVTAIAVVTYAAWKVITETN